MGPTRDLSSRTLVLGVGDWYYIGHYGQLGPLTRDQIDELVHGGVIARDTFVWRAGMDNWLPAERVTELVALFAATQAYTPPPPPPSPGSPNASTPPVYAPPPPQHNPFGAPMVPGPNMTPMSGPAYYPTYGGLRSDRSRTAAGVLQLFLPGVGRMYLGYLAYGVMQLVLFFATCGIFYIWSIIDGIIILTGGVKLDGYGRVLND